MPEKQQLKYLSMQVSIEAFRINCNQEDQYGLSDSFRPCCAEKTFNSFTHTSAVPEFVLQTN